MVLGRRRPISCTDVGTSCGQCHKEPLQTLPTTPRRQARQQFPGVLVNVCALPELAYAHASTLWLCILPSLCLTDKSPASSDLSGGDLHRAFQTLVHGSDRQRYTVGALLTVSTTRALPAVTVKPSLPGQWQPTCSRAHLPPCDQERILFLHDVIMVFTARASLTFLRTSTKAYSRAGLGGVENSDCFSPPIAFPGMPR